MLLALTLSIKLIKKQSQAVSNKYNKIFSIYRLVHSINGLSHGTDNIDFLLPELLQDSLSEW